MAEDPESTAEVAQVLETTEATAEPAEIAVAPVVLPPESMAKDEEITQVKEVPQLDPEDPPKVQMNPEEIIIQEETGPTAEVEPAEEGQDRDNPKHTLTFNPEPHVEEAPEIEEREAAEGEEVEEATKPENVESQDALKDKLDRERKERVKNALTNRFKVVLPTPEPFQIPELDDDEEEEEGQEEEARQDSMMEEPPVIDTAIWENIEEHVEEEAEGAGERSSKKDTGPRMVGIFAPLRQGAFDDDEDIFYKDPKYDKPDKYELEDAISLLSLKSLRSMKSTRSMGADSVQLKSDFLRDFEIPSLSDISEEHDPEPEQRLTYLSSTSSMSLRDHGHFVDPLTGDAMPSSESSSSFETASQFGPEDQEVVSPGLKEGSSDLSDMPDYPGFPSEVPKPRQEVQVTFEEMASSFYALQSHVKFEDDDDEGRVKTQEVENMVKDFVDDLLGKLVAQFEGRLWKNVLRSKCDKKKLFAELLTVTDHYIFEKYTNGLLNARLVEYYKRVRNNRAFGELDQEKETQYFVRYTQALNTVDSLKAHLVEVKHRHARQIHKVILDLHSAQSVASFTEARLEATVRKYLVRPDSDFLHRYVDYSLRLMAAKRNEISDMRLVLITKKHTLGLLQKVSKGITFFLD